MNFSSSNSRAKISEERVKKAANALLKWRNLQSKSQDLRDDHGDDDDFIYLQITIKKTPPQELTLAPHRIHLSHSLYPQGLSLLNVCLIVDGKRITSEAAQKKLKSENLPITRVLKLSKIKSDYRSFEAKTKLYSSFDLFFAERRVLQSLPKILGKCFYRKKRKIPVPVNLVGNSNWREEFDRAWASGLLCLSSGTCSVVRVGKWGVTDCQQIVENVFAAIDGIVEIIPKKWRGIRNLHLKFSDSLALPIYEYQPKLLPNENEGGNDDL